MSVSSTDVEPEVSEWLGREIRLLACDQCGRITLDFTVSEVFVGQEGGTLPWVTCQECIDDWEDTWR